MSNLYQYCYVDWEKWYQITAVAIPERWEFADGAMSVFKPYISLTFERLCDEGKVLVSDSGNLLAFNTGLVTSSYDDILVCMEPNTVRSEERRHPWQYLGYCVAGSGELGRRVRSEFATIPRRARYVTSLDEIVYDRDLPLRLNEEHILRDNLYRFPTEYLKQRLHQYIEARKKLYRIKMFVAPALKANGQAIELAKKQSCEVFDEIAKDAKLLHALRQDLRQEVEKARRRAGYNQRAAMPIYYPRHKRMSMLLPLCMGGAEPNLALVVTRDSDAYRGRTVLGMKEAYVDARLVNRMEPDWLTLR